MGCQNIGRGLNNVVRAVISLYDSRKIGLVAARVIIATCRDSVNWCDGDEYDAVDCIGDCRCGRCLRLVPKGELLLNVWCVPDDFKSDRDAFYKNAYATYRFCETCFPEVVATCYEGVEPDTVLEWRDYIMKNCSESDYLSTGEMNPV